MELIKQDTVSYILGNHIEMTNTPTVDYPVEATYLYITIIVVLSLL